jgi:predicted trehalose synthase
MDGAQIQAISSRTVYLDEAGSTGAAIRATASVLAACGDEWATAAISTMPEPKPCAK